MAASGTMIKSPKAAGPNWITMLAAGSAIVSVTLGIRHLFGLFLVPISADLGTGLQTFSLAIALQNIAWGLASPLFGAMADRIGAWRVAALGALIYTAGLLTTVFVVHEVGIIAGQLLVGMGMASAGISVALGAVARAAPPEKRSLAMGLVTSFGSFGQFILLPITSLLMGAYGWQGALLVLSALTASMIAMSLGLRGDKPATTAELAAHDARGALRQALGSKDYILLTTGFFVCGFQLVFITTHLPVYLSDAGLSRNVTSWALGLVGLFNIAGAFICGWLGGFRSKRNILAIVYLCRGLIMGLFALLPVTPIGALIFGASMGLFWLGTIPLTSGLIVVFFGARYLSMLYGVVFLSHQLGSFLGAWLGGFIYDTTGNYDAMWALGALSGVAAFAINLAITQDKPRSAAG